MRIPDSVSIAYEEALAIAIPLAEIAGSRLRVLAASNGWLFDDRIKSAESCLSKLESGAAPLSELHDFYAAMIVVPTQNELDSAAAKVLELFNGEVKVREGGTPETFVYDDIHVLARLEGRVSPRGVPSPTVLLRKFEIQIRTGIQYAWWRATHDDMYKSSQPESHSWEMKRAAGQSRAALELLDGLLSDLPAAAAIQRSRSSPVDEMAARAILELWPMRSRPVDVFRFCQTTDRLLSAAGGSIDGTLAHLGTRDMEPALSAPGITPLQAVVISVFRQFGTGFQKALLDGNLRVLVTEEMVSLEAGLALLDPAVVSTA